MNNRILKDVSYIKANGEFRVVNGGIIRETSLHIILDGSPFATAMILASMEKEYVLGHLYVQGVINGAEDVLAWELENDIAGVRLRPSRNKRVIPETVESLLTIDRGDVYSCVEAVLRSPVFEQTEAVHSAGLFLDGQETISVTEDLGRHNALDKVIGAGLLKQVDFGRVIAASTGRQPAEMILKCRSAGIPIIATKGVPTSMGIEAAEKAGIAIVGLVRKGSLVVYCHPERIR